MPDSVNRIGDVLDDDKQHQSFGSWRGDLHDRPLG
jgi:hypothetical protein